MSKPSIGILGTGTVGFTLAKGLAAAGYPVMIGTRDQNSERITKWLPTAGANVRIGSNEDAVRFGDMVIVATKWIGTRNAIDLAGPAHFAGKTVIDTTNPIAPEPPTGGVLHYSVSMENSGLEEIQRWLPDAHVVKAFSVVGAAHMVNPSFPDGDPDMWICGNNAAAKNSVTSLLGDLGWRSVIDAGPAEAARAVELFCIQWCLYGFKTGTWNHAFKLVKK